MIDIDNLVPDGVMYNGLEYRLKKKCKMKEIYPGIFSPKCNREIVMNYKDEHWRFCPFCGGVYERE